MNENEYYEDTTPGHAPTYLGYQAVAVGEQAAVTYAGEDIPAWYGEVVSHTHITADGVFVGTTRVLFKEVGTRTGLAPLIGTNQIVDTREVTPR